MVGMNLREQRVFEMLDSGIEPQSVNSETFVVPSQINPKKKYQCKK